MLLPYQHVEERDILFQMFACACLWRVNELFCDLISSLEFQTDSLANTRNVSKFTGLSVPLFALLERGWVRDYIQAANEISLLRS